MTNRVTKTESLPRPRKAPRKSEKPDAKWILRRCNGLQILEASLLGEIDWLTHGFSTRPGGASELEIKRNGRATKESVLNLGFTDWDTREHVIKNRQKFQTGLGATKVRVVGLRQIHSDVVYTVGAADVQQGMQAPQGDALITRKRGVLLVVQAADCLPILLADIKQRAIAAIHSGWRGTAQRITEKTLGRMQMEFGTRPQDVIAAIGPGIGQCCYEVGYEVVKEFAAKFPSARDWFAGPFDTLEKGDNDSNWLPWLTMRPPGHAPSPPRVKLDLVAANRVILASAGVAPEKILSSDLCTACRSDLFFSYRRERSTGRMMAAIGIR
ncbi:MAG: peptidoglycan editing factor PgeF [Candidatus Acidiferrales bacterium]